MKKTFTFHTRSRLWILCAAVCMVWAVPLHAQTRRISLNLKNATIQQAVIALQQQGYSLSVKADDVDMKAPVDIHARNEELQAVVDRIFAGQDVNCIINDKSILITKVPSQPSSEDSPQESSVTGQVKGPNGLPLVGVTVLIDGTMVGTTTDASGNFRIRAKSGDTLVFSYIGYDERREKVGVRTEIDVTLAESSTLVNEVVVIGYGTQSRRTLSTAISKVSGEVLDNAPAATVGDALKGRVAGRTDEQRHSRRVSPHDDSRRIVHHDGQRSDLHCGRGFARGPDRYQYKRHRVDGGAQGRRLGQYLRR